MVRIDCAAPRNQYRSTISDPFVAIPVVLVASKRIQPDRWTAFEKALGDRGDQGMNVTERSSSRSVRSPRSKKQNSPTKHARGIVSCATIHRVLESSPRSIIRSVSSEVSAVKTANTANMSDRFVVDAATGATVSVFAMTATVHRY